MNYPSLPRAVRIRWPIGFLLASTLTACATSVDTQLSYIDAPNMLSTVGLEGVASPSAFNTPPGKRGGSLLYVGSFNIENLGPKKIDHADVMKRLGEIIRQYDVIAIQEVSDSKGKAPIKLLDYVNKNGVAFDYVLSARTGLEPDDKSSQEQYAIYYDTKAVELVHDFGVYDDSLRDDFQREPQVAQFRTLSGNFEFGVVNIHTRPTSAVAEIESLDKVATWAKKKIGTLPLIILGDFNGGCNYAKPDALNALSIRGPKYSWVVPDSADSTVASNRCAYDRIVLTDASRYADKWSVWQAFQSPAISDHWPIWAAFKISN